MLSLVHLPDHSWARVFILQGSASAAAQAELGAAADMNAAALISRQGSCSPNLQPGRLIAQLCAMILSDIYV